MLNDGSNAAAMAGRNRCSLGLGVRIAFLRLLADNHSDVKDAVSKMNLKPETIKKYCRRWDIQLTDYPKAPEDK